MINMVIHHLFTVLNGDDHSGQQWLLMVNVNHLDSGQ